MCIRANSLIIEKMPIKGLVSAFRIKPFFMSTIFRNNIDYEDSKIRLNLWKNRSLLSNYYNSNSNNTIDIFTINESDVDSSTGFIKASEYLVCKQIFASSNKAYKSCKDGLVCINGTKIFSTRKLRIGDVMSVILNKTHSGVNNNNDMQSKNDEINLNRLLNFTNSLINIKENNRLKILYEDDLVAIVFKPSGIHSLRWIGTMKKRYFALDDVLPLLLIPPRLSIDSSNNNLSIVNKYHVLERPLPCHRLDARVSGCIVVAKTQQALGNINNQFANRLVHKEYLAIVAGKINLSASNGSSSELEITYPVGGRPAHTILRIINETDCNIYGTLTRVALFPMTGRRHQLRQHCVAIGCPIIG